MLAEIIPAGGYPLVQLNQENEEGFNSSFA